MVTFDIVLPLEESCPDTLDLNMENEEINWGHPCNPNVNIVLMIFKYLDKLKVNYSRKLRSFWLDLDFNYS